MSYSNDNSRVPDMAGEAMRQSPLVNDGSGDDRSERREVVTPQEYSQLTGISMSTVRRYLADGRLPKLQPGGPRCRVLIPRWALFAIPVDEPHAPEGGIAQRPCPKEAEEPADIATRTLPGPRPRWRQQRN